LFLELDPDTSGDFGPFEKQFVDLVAAALSMAVGVSQCECGQPMTHHPKERRADRSARTS